MSARAGCALITGASRGIGASVARALARDGWPVALNFRTDERGARDTAVSIEREGGRTVCLRGDVADPAVAVGLVADAGRELGCGPVLVLVNNAGVTADALSLSLSDEQWSAVINTNLSGAFRLTRAAIGPMVRARFGRVVNIASVIGPRANAGQANYAASKAGLIGMTRTIAVEVARRGVTVNAVAPGLIDTEMTDGLAPELLAAVPARRAGEPDEVAHAVAFLASEQAAYITASTVYVDGGLSA